MALSVERCAVPLPEGRSSLLCYRKPEVAAEPVGFAPSEENTEESKTMPGKSIGGMPFSEVWNLATIFVSTIKVYVSKQGRGAFAAKIKRKFGVKSPVRVFALPQKYKHVQQLVSWCCRLRTYSLQRKCWSQLIKVLPVNSSI